MQVRKRIFLLSRVGLLWQGDLLGLNDSRAASFNIRLGDAVVDYADYALYVIVNWDGFEVTVSN